nr:DUF29 family protein [uncultured Rhodopila sp.]
MPDTIETLQSPASRALHEADEHAWIAARISALSPGQFDRLDRASLIEYLTEMTILDRRELKSRLIVLLHHLLKLHAQPEKLTPSWIATIIEQQSEIGSLIESIPNPGGAGRRHCGIRLAGCGSPRSPRNRPPCRKLPRHAHLDGRTGPGLRSARASRAEVTAWLTQIDPASPAV